MRPRHLVAVSSMVVALGAGVGALLFEEERRIVVARHAMTAGTRVTLRDVAAVRGKAEHSIGVERVARVIGAVLIRDVEAGEALTEAHLEPTVTSHSALRRMTPKNPSVP